MVAKEFFPRIQGRQGHTGVAADLGNALVVGRHHLFDDLFFELKLKLTPFHAHASICFMALILYRVIRQRLKEAGHSVSPESALAQLRKFQRQSVAINQGVPVSGISNIHREQADLLAAMNIR